MRGAGIRGAVPLTGADCFLRAFDAEIRRCNGANHLSQLVLRLGAGFDVAILQKLLEEVARAQPILSAPIRRRFGVGPPVYATRASRGTAPALRVVEVEPPADGKLPIPPLFATRLNEPMAIRRGELLRFDAVRYAGGAAGTDLAMTWAHMLFDGAGSEHFVRWLDECFRGERRPESLPDPGEFDLAPRPPLGERGRAARDWQRWHDGFGALPLRSPAGPRHDARQALRYQLLSLTPDESQSAADAARKRAGFLTPMLFYLAAAIRAHHAVFRARDIDPGSYLVPLPVNLRRPGSEGAIFRTHVSLIWFHVPSHRVDDFGALLDLLKDQRLSAIKRGHIENGVHAMDFARFAPERLYAHMARRSLGGELCSFFFAYTGEFLPGLEHFLGAGVRSGFHVAPVPPSPGSCLALSFHRGCLNATHVHQDGVFSEYERQILGEQLRADLLS